CSPPTQSKATSTPERPESRRTSHGWPASVVGTTADHSERFRTRRPVTPLVGPMTSMPRALSRARRCPPDRRGGSVDHRDADPGAGVLVDHEQGRERVGVDEAGLLRGEGFRYFEAPACGGDLVLLPVLGRSQGQHPSSQKTRRGSWVRLHHFADALETRYEGVAGTRGVGTREHDEGGGGGGRGPEGRTA